MNAVAPRADRPLPTYLLAGGIGADGERVDVRCDPATGLIAAVGPSLLPREQGEQVVDCAGMVVLPGPVEPHCHLDKALSGDRAPNPAGDLPGAIKAWHAYRPQLDEADIAQRARAAALELIAHGTTTIRSHIDVGPGIGLRGINAAAGVKQQFIEEGLADLQLVALVSPPFSGDGADQVLALLREAMESGADVVGGVPHTDSDPVAATWALVGVAAELGLPLDLHVDETLDPKAVWLEDLAEAVMATPGIPSVNAGHCVSLGVQPPERQAEVAAKVAAAGINVITLPQSNLYLQSRGRDVAPPRGLTALRALLDAGVNVAAGGDNVRDPFNSIGRSDALETAATLVLAGHLSPAEAWHAVSAASRQAVGLPPVTLTVGAPAELVALRGASLTEAIALASDQRIAVHRGAVVASTTVTTTFGAATPAPATSDPTPSLVPFS